MSTQIVTANRLSDGAVVYLDAGDGWSRRLSDGLTAADADSANLLLSKAAQAVEARIVVGPYLIDVSGDGPGPQPVSMREAIRANGPTVPAGTASEER